MTKKPKKRNPGSEKWKTIRVPRKPLDLMRATLRANPPPDHLRTYFEAETISDCNMVTHALLVASGQICGKLFEEWFGLLRPEFERLVKLAQQAGMIQVAAHFGATIRPEADGSFSIVKANRKEVALPTLQAPTVPATMFH